MDKVRFGIIGVGGMGAGHTASMQDIEECELTAVCDVDSVMAKRIASQYNVQSFTDYKSLIDSRLTDAVIVATPHYSHSPISIYAMQKGVGVISEKPMAVTVKAADEMVKLAKKGKVPFAVMYQKRTSAAYQAAHKLIKEGRLGKLYRTCLINTGFRSQAYYDSAGWRATWKTEGGGVLINQAPHALDIFSWLGGLPSRIVAQTSTRRHRIEVEDEASALLEYSNGAIGYIHLSTTEAPGTDFMEFCGEKGKLMFSHGKITFWELQTPAQEFSDSTTEMWGNPESYQWEFAGRIEEGSHAAIIRNFARHILQGEPLISPGVEGIKSLELINGIILSGKKGKAVSIPLDRGEYEEVIKKLGRISKKKKITSPAKRITDPSFKV